MSDSSLDPRRAYEVRRYHVWPVHHQQTVGEHSAQVWRIVRAIWPNAPNALLDHCLTHDIGELISGDLPYPTKANNKVLREEIEKIELSTHQAMTEKWGLPPPSQLTEFERTVFKLAEFLEMWEYGLNEVLLGNRNALLIVERMRIAFCKLLDSSLLCGSPLNQAIKQATLVYIAERKRYFSAIKGSQ
jgi:hypothetical protein